MSADEIRKLAQQAAADKITNKVASHYGMDESCSRYETALLAYAEMVERCEDKRKELDEEWFFDGADELTLPMEECYSMLDYILRGDAGGRRRDDFQNKRRAVHI